jgi:hypothetical protein
MNLGGVSRTSYIVETQARNCRGIGILYIKKTAALHMKRRNFEPMMGNYQSWP